MPINRWKWRKTPEERRMPRGRVATVDYKEAEKLYVTEGKSYRELATQFGVSHTSMAEQGRKGDWQGRRIAYEQSIARRSYENLADAVAHEQSEIRKESVLAARAYVRKFILDLNAGEIRTNAKDAGMMIGLLVGELAPMQGNGPSTDAPTIVVPGASDTEFLRRVLEVARGRVAPAGGMGTGLLLEPPGTRPD